ncbi:MAG: hypothetical protein AAF349_07400 [Cyanobacteria bacterium P01_A01_bin.68]|uniref:Uncharacterized protein n=1 Tax=Calothrix parasitica NIES-267 TaxID=1973488 RepID=A0A1Z4LWH2_9CYAN|nr:hypothetical protein [Cyanobacteriota bacterium]BAY85573.1 hypothetical protein NIES267_50730 [Calothrix parasitica NIES-267]
MAKRRNLKKEKALRNQAYARKFRKRTNTGRYQRRYQQGPPKQDEEQNNSATDDNTGAAATD